MIDHDGVGLLMATVSLRSAWLISALKTNVGIAHVALDFRFGHERGNGVHNHNVNGPLRTSASVISSACSPVSGWESKDRPP
jgi:hypothetical protein